MKESFSFGLIAVLFWSSSALACKYAPGTAPKLDIMKALNLSISESKEWNQAKVISAMPLARSNDQSVSHSAIVLKNTDQSCHLLTVKLYGGDGDCRERVQFITSEKVAPHLCATK